MSYPPPVSAAPNYGQPPRKNRAGLIIVLVVVLLVGILTVGGVLAYRLVSDKLQNSSAPDPGTSIAPATSPTPKRTAPAPQPTVKPTTKPTAKPTTRPTARPTAPPVTKPAVTTPPANATDLARRFVAQLNANNPKGAAALACPSAKALIPTLMDTFLDPPTHLTIGPTTGQGVAFAVPLSGTTHGSTVAGFIAITNLAPDPLCIRAFTLTPV